VYTPQQWAEVEIKEASGQPIGIRDDGGFPLRTLSISPIPTNADELALYTWSQIPQHGISSVNEVFDLPNGYRRALAFGLAVEMAAEAGQTLKDEVVSLATLAKGNIKRLNMETILSKTDVASMNVAGDFDIYTSGQ
jgi:hypothetical protein